MAEARQSGGTVTAMPPEWNFLFPTGCLAASAFFLDELPRPSGGASLLRRPPLP